MLNFYKAFVVIGLVTTTFEHTVIAYIHPVATVRAPLPLIAPAIQQQQQYHTQDIYGQYAYGYSEPLSSKQEIRTLDGITRGSYTYIDANAKRQTVQYIADADGFRVAATNLPTINLAATPMPVTETPEVAAARAQHLAAHEEQKRLNPLSFTHLPRPVEDTPEVAAAKAAFFARYEEEKRYHKLLRERDALLYAVKNSLLRSKGQSIVPSSGILYNVIAPERTYLPASA